MPENQKQTNIYFGRNEFHLNDCIRNVFNSNHIDITQQHTKRIFIADIPNYIRNRRKQGNVVEKCVYSIVS